MQSNNDRNMKKVCLCCLLFLVTLFANAQSTQEKLENATQQLVSDTQMKHAILGLYIIDAKNGTVIIDKNGSIGLAPASCQKLFTSVAAFELLGHDYRYKTEIGYDGKIEDLTLKGNLHIFGTGDPTFGSERWDQTKEENVMTEISEALKKFRINRITGDVFIDDSKFSIQPIPDGWIWQDIGNYYGAGCWGINWHENQYDMILQTGAKIGDDAGISATKPGLPANVLINQFKTAEKGSGDNAYIYLPPYSLFAFTQGTMPLGESNFSISGSIPDAPAYFAKLLEKNFLRSGIKTAHPFKTNIDRLIEKRNWPSIQSTLFTHYSPTLDSMNYWFLKKSINLYGEAFVKTIAYKKTGFGSTDKGIELVKDFWKSQGIESSAINIIDGSGLSPQNRVTPDALVKALQYAATRTWYKSFYSALPEINGMKMKSGSIGGAKSYAGYQSSKDGKDYIFAIIVNNYDGSSNEIVRKMWKILDLLK
ncbi:MAG: D-alanyl-D-alanine carboxypeptidase/D-alanyl-D-alanine-endopeptidase [Bacteroidetes bacterium]|nr:D-alanyl-D-alanine carboxypeptidase/D-alanyl-D-alanine-endopeptidase [Bacteroidota bacterium]